VIARLQRVFYNIEEKASLSDDFLVISEFLVI
jgi:hypothetical protein